MKSFFGIRPLLFARNGAIPSMPRDTLEAYKAAFDAGATVIYSAARLSADMHLVLSGDRDFSAAAGENARVGAMTIDEIKALDAGHYFRDPVSDEFTFRGKGVRFITLDEALDSFPDRRFNIEIADKGERAVDALRDVVERHKAVDRVLVYSMYASTIGKVRASIPEIATSLSLTGVLGLYALFRTGFLYFKRGFKADALQIPEVIGPSFVGNQGMIRESSARGLKVIISVDNSQAQIRRLIEAGADGFITDDIPQLVKILGEIKPDFCDPDVI